MMLKMHSTMSGIIGEMDGSSQNANAMGQAFDASKNDDSFYLPPDVFKQPDFQRAMNTFLSPDGKAARFIISHKGDPASAEGISRIDPDKAGGRRSAQDAHRWRKPISLSPAPRPPIKDWRRRLRDTIC